MAKVLPWLKMWVESLDDPKMLRLTLAEEAAWWRLLRLAQRCNAGGSLITSSGSPLTTDEIATCLHITSTEDVVTFNSMLEKLETEGSLCWNNKTLNIIHFGERQEMVASETPEAVRERVRLYRERHRVTETPLPAETPSLTPIPTTIDKEVEVEVEQRRYSNGTSPLHFRYSNEKSVTAPPNSKDVTTKPLPSNEKSVTAPPNSKDVTTKPLPSNEKSVTAPEQEPLSDKEIELLRLVRGLKHWGSAEDDVEWLLRFENEFPEFGRGTLTACVDYYSGRADPKHKGQWKARLRNWMLKERQYAAKQKDSGQRGVRRVSGSRKAEDFKEKW